MFTPVNTRGVDIATNLQFLHKQTRLTLEIELLNWSVCGGTAVKGFSGEERLVLYQSRSTLTVFCSDGKVLSITMFLSAR
jgi:hypothetical protein